MSGWLAKQIAEAKAREARLEKAYGAKVWAVKRAVILGKYEKAPQ